MSDRPWWSHALQWGIWALVMSLVMAWLAKARRPAVVTKGGRVLTHPPTTLIIGIIGTGFSIVIAILAWRYAKPDERWTTYCFISFALLSALMIGEALRVRHDLTEEGIAYQGLWTRYQMVSWDQVESAKWSTSMKWLVLTTRDRRVLRFSGMLNGLDSLALALEERVPELDADEATAGVLADACRGILPSVWG